MIISWLGYGVDTPTFVHGIYDRTVTVDTRCCYRTYPCGVGRVASLLLCTLEGLNRRVIYVGGP